MCFVFFFRCRKVVEEKKLNTNATSHRECAERDDNQGVYRGEEGRVDMAVVYTCGLFGVYRHWIRTKKNNFSLSGSGGGGAAVAAQVVDRVFRFLAAFGRLLLSSCLVRSIACS